MTTETSQLWCDRHNKTVAKIEALEARLRRLHTTKDAQREKAFAALPDDAGITMNSDDGTIGPVVSWSQA